MNKKLCFPFRILQADILLFSRAEIILKKAVEQKKVFFMHKRAVDIIRHAKTIEQINAASMQLLEEAKRQGLLGRGLSAKQQKRLQKFLRASDILNSRKIQLAKMPVRVVLPKKYSDLLIERAKKRRAGKRR